jgi:hypothetical protein
MASTKIDLDTYLTTQNLPGGPIIVMTDDDVPEIQMIVDENGDPTKGGLIGYYLAYTVLAGLVAYIFVVL